MWWLFWIAMLGLLVVGLIVLAKKSEVEQARHIEQRDAERRVRAEEVRLAREAFISTELLGSNVTDCIFEEKPALISAPADADFRITQLNSKYTWTILSERVIPISEIRAVEVVQDDVVEKYSRKVTTPVAVNKKKSAIGRGLVGGCC